MTLQMLLSWWNLIYLIPLAIALVYLVLYMVTGISFGEADADADVHIDIDADADVDVDADIDVDADVDVETDADADADHDVEHDVEHDVHAEPALGATLMSIMGVGKMPVSLILLVLMMVWGVVGLAGNRVMYALLPVTWLAVLVSAPVALLAGVTASGGVARLMAKFLKPDEALARSKASLVNSIGEVVMFDTATGFGTVQVHDEKGELHQVSAQVRKGSPALVHGQRVVLFDFDREAGIYHVALFDEAGGPTRKKLEETEEGKPTQVQKKGVRTM